MGRLLRTEDIAEIGDFDDRRHQLLASATPLSAAIRAAPPRFSAHWLVWRAYLERAGLA